MSWTGWLCYGLLILWVLPGALWGRPARALAASWTLGEIVAQAYGVQTPIALYYATDVASIAYITKLRRSVLPTLAARDWLIIALYLFEWTRYPEGQAAWWPLFYATMAQFMLAGPWPQIMRASKEYSHGKLGATRHGGT